MTEFHIFVDAVQRVHRNCHHPRTDREQAVLEFLVSASRWTQHRKTWNTGTRLWRLL